MTDNFVVLRVVSVASSDNGSLLVTISEDGLEDPGCEALIRLVYTKRVLFRDRFWCLVGAIGRDMIELYPDPGGNVSVFSKMAHKDHR